MLFCRDISFLYDANVPDKKILDSAGKQLITPASYENKTSPGDKQLELVEKSRGESETMVKFWRIMELKSNISSRSSFIT